MADSNGNFDLDKALAQMSEKDLNIALSKAKKAKKTKGKNRAEKITGIFNKIEAVVDEGKQDLFDNWEQVRDDSDVTSGSSQVFSKVKKIGDRKLQFTLTMAYREVENK